MEHHTLDWRAKVEKLRDIPAAKARIDADLAAVPGYFLHRANIINNFFAQHPSPVDITFLLEGALNFAHQFAYHFEGNNLLFYRPKSRSKLIKNTFLIGEAHPERELLFVDTDLIMGVAMEDSAKHFIKLGYKSQNMHVYLNEGWGPELYRPVLGPLDKFHLLE